MSLENALIAALDEETVPFAAWKKSKEGVQKGTTATKGQAKYGEFVEGPELVQRVEDFAVDFYKAWGMEGSGDPKMQAHSLRQALGDDYAPFRQALKLGDVDDANKMIKDAITSQMSSARLTGVSERMTQLDPAKRISMGKTLVEKVGGKDYVAAATNPQALVATIQRQKELAIPYQ